MRCGTAVPGYEHSDLVSSDPVTRCSAGLPPHQMPASSAQRMLARCPVRGRCVSIFLWQEQTSHRSVSRPPKSTQRPPHRRATPVPKHPADSTAAGPSPPRPGPDIAAQHSTAGTRHHHRGQKTASHPASQPARRIIIQAALLQRQSAVDRKSLPEAGGGRAGGGGRTAAAMAASSSSACLRAARPPPILPINPLLRPSSPPPARTRSARMRAPRGSERVCAPSHRVVGDHIIFVEGRIPSCPRTACGGAH
jgi:hypothetical protein